MASVPALVQPHVPAWKKIGLKLRYAKEEPASLLGTGVAAGYVTQTRCNLEDRPNARNTLDTSSSQVRPSKRNKRSNVESHQASLPTNRSAQIASNPSTAISTEPTPSNSLPSTSLPVLKNRKSVSFTPETKTEDGDSTKELFAQWVIEQKSADPSFKLHESAALPKLGTVASKLSASAHLDPQLGVRKSKKPKLKAKSKVKSGKPSQLSTNTAPAALNYLNTFTASPSEWKFSKNHQNYLIKHLFDLDKIPSSYDPEIYKYLLGLKGASSRQRIRSTALQVRRDNEMWLSDILNTELAGDEKAQRRRREAYEEAWKKEKGRLEDLEHEREEDHREGKKWKLEGKQYTDWEKKVFERKRAEAVLWSVGEIDTVDLSSETQGSADSGSSRAGATADPQVNGTRPAHGQVKGKRRRKRKRRTTGVPDDSSSSSEPNSDEEKVTTQEPRNKRASASELVDEGPAGAGRDRSSSESDS